MNSQYQNVAKRKGGLKLTAPRALIAELVRRYWVLGMECSLLATVDWLLVREGIEPEIDAVLAGIGRWPVGKTWAERKARLFDRRAVGIALDRLTSTVG
jgi:hypothetical protein